MLRTYVICVPPNTSSSNPSKTKVELPIGVLTQTKILIPAGHNGLTGIRILRGIETIVPWHQEDWIKGSNVVITDPTNLELENDPTYLTVECYNEDDTYQHCFYLYFVVQPPEQLSNRLMYQFLKRLRLLR